MFNKVTEYGSYLRASFISPKAFKETILFEI